jgi:hypothetical protein
MQNLESDLEIAKFTNGNLCGLTMGRRFFYCLCCRGSPILTEVYRGGQNACQSQTLPDGTVGMQEPGYLFVTPICNPIKIFD